ncbi:hypothetical protein K9L97_01355 [Candidatus Woesearchaeota archaeon]|nr:hypothetical protein [Candidatus Woesearchaeota archaeon]
MAIQDLVRNIKDLKNIQESLEDITVVRPNTDWPSYHSAYETDKGTVVTLGATKYLVNSNGKVLTEGGHHIQHKNGEFFTGYAIDNHKVDINVDKVTQILKSNEFQKMKTDLENRNWTSSKYQEEELRKKYGESNTQIAKNIDIGIMFEKDNEFYLTPEPFKNPHNK